MKATKKLYNLNSSVYFLLDKSIREWMKLSENDNIVEWEDNEDGSITIRKFIPKQPYQVEL